MLSLAPYIPELLIEWQEREPDSPWIIREGTLVSADISGFTALSESLASDGRAGAEELTDLINACFDPMIERCAVLGGDVLKFGGDALLVWFAGADHTIRAANAAFDMRATIARPLARHSGDAVRLRVSIGLHTGSFTFFCVDGRHRELVVTGAAVTTTLNCEAEASAGQILLSAEAAAHIPKRCRRDHDAGALLTRRVDTDPTLPTPTLPTPTLRSVPSSATLLTKLIDPDQRSELEAGNDAGHRQATIAFVKFSHTDFLLATAGEAPLHAFLQAVTESIAAATAQFGTHWLATDVSPDGGKFILVSGVPTSAGDDEARLLRTVRAVLDNPALHNDSALCNDSALRNDEDPAQGTPVLRAGAHRGTVFVGNLGSRRRRTFTVMGDAVNLAARLMQKAAPEQLVVTRSTLDWSQLAFELTPLAPFRVKGKQNEIHAAVLGRCMGSIGNGTDRTAMFGRDVELGILIDAAERARNGHGCAMAVSGDLGAGRSRLVRELIQRCPDISLGSVTCLAYERDVPYGAARGLLRSLLSIDGQDGAVAAGRKLSAWVQANASALVPWLPLIAVPFGADVPSTAEATAIRRENRRARTHQLVTELVRAIDRTVLLVVDDSAHLDDASRELFDWFAAAAPFQRWLLCEIGEGPARPDRTLVEVLPLDDSSVLAMIEAALSGSALFDVAISGRDMRTISDRARGNPLFVLQQLELALSGVSVEAIPDSIEAIITAQIDRLRPEDRRVLRESAVLGSTVDLDLLADVLGPEEVRRSDRWERLEPFLESETRGRLRFRHPLLQQTAYDGLSFRRRRELHLAVGAVIENRERNRLEEVVDVLALHFGRAEDAARTWVYGIAAADRAFAASAMIEAAEMYARVLHSAKHLPVPRSEHARVAEAFGDAEERNARFATAAVAYSSARRLTSEPVDAARLLRKVGVLRERAGRYNDALRWYRRATAALDGSGVRAVMAEQADLLTASAGIRHRQGRHRASLDDARKAVQLARTASSPAAEAHAQQLVEVSAVRLGIEVDRIASLELYRALGDDSGQARAANNLGVAAYFAGAWAEASSWYEASRVAGERAGDVIQAMTALNNRAEILSDQGHLEAAAADFREAARTWQAARYPVGATLAISNLGRVAARSGDFAAARRWLERAIAEFAAIGASSLDLEARLRLAETALLEGNTEQAHETADALRAALDRPDTEPSQRAGIRRCFAIIAAQRGDDAVAEEELRHSMSDARAASAPFELVQGLLVARKLHQEGRLALLDQEDPAPILARLGIGSIPVPPLVGRRVEHLEVPA